MEEHLFSFDTNTRARRRVIQSKEIKELRILRRRAARGMVAKGGQDPDTLKEQPIFARLELVQDANLS
jgi:hypothetical protein